MKKCFQKWNAFHLGSPSYFPKCILRPKLAKLLFISLYFPKMSWLLNTNALFLELFYIFDYNMIEICSFYLHNMLKISENAPVMKKYYLQEFSFFADSEYHIQVIVELWDGIIHDFLYWTIARKVSSIKNLKSKNMMR